MFGRKKKEPKVEKVFETADSSNAGEETKENSELEGNLNEILGVEEEETPEVELSEQEQEKLDKLDSVKSKISKILQSSNIEIVDENEGDEYDTSIDGDAQKRQQQDYDSLKAMFGDGDKNKKQELTLTIDDFDYSYTGQYVDEYDLVHLKNIKKIKLQSKHKKLTKRLIIAASVLLVVGIAVTLGIVLTRKPQVYLKAVSLSQTEQTYFLNETFDYRGIYIISEYSNGTITKTKLNSSHFTDSTGYVERPSSTELVFADGTDATLYFTYAGFRTSIKINIVQKVVSGIEMKTSSDFRSLKTDEYLTEDDLLVFVNYSNYLSEKIDLSKVIVRINYERLPDYDEENKGIRLTTDLSSLGEDDFLEIEYEGLKAVYYFN